MKRRFEWDPAKASSNVRKHGISFGTATLIFDDPYAIVDQDRIEGGEYRWRTIGAATGFILLTVAHTIRDEDVEIIRIISARPADRKERRRYEQQFG